MKEWAFDRLVYSTAWAWNISNDSNEIFNIHDHFQTSGVRAFFVFHTVLPWKIYFCISRVFQVINAEVCTHYLLGLGGHCLY